MRRAAGMRQVMSVDAASDAASDAAHAAQTTAGTLPLCFHAAAHKMPEYGI